MKDALIRAPVFLLVWVGMLALKIPTALLGFVVVPFLYPYRARDYEDLPFWTRLHANPEDWTGGPEGVEGKSLPLWWVRREGSGFWSFYRYHAIRNPANGIRSIEALDLDIIQDKIRYWTPRYLPYYEPWYLRREFEMELRSCGYICWQGWKAGAKFVYLWSPSRHFVFKFGWRVEPRDAHEPLDPDGQRAQEGAGFASKLLPYREG